MKYILSIALICAAAGLGLAQQYTPSEYGTPAELKGLTRVFVTTGAQVQLRTEVIKALEKQKATDFGLVIVDRYDDAEIVLGLVTDYDGNFTKGRGYVARPVPGGSRVLLEFARKRALRIGKSNAEKLVERFLREYRKVNGISK